jgi:DNA-binding transcriptional LysR family regulator
MLTPRMIDAFRAVILNGSMSEAAVFLHISQPAVSRLIRDMEAQIGFRLFDRRHGRVFANEDALELFEEVHRAYIGLDRITQAAEQIRKRESGALQIACMPVVGLSIMPRVIAKLRKTNPGINISLHVFRSTTVMQSLTTLRCHVGFVEYAFTAPSLAEGPVFDLDTVCVLPQGHRLAGEAVIEPKHLKNETFVSLDPDSKTRIKIDTIFETSGVSRSMQIEAPLTNVVCSLVLEGCGVSIVDPLSAGMFADKGLIARPFRPTASFSFRALSTPRLSETALLKEFYEIFAHTLSENSLANGVA